MTNSESDGAQSPDSAAADDDAATLTALFGDGPLQGARMRVAPVEGRPPKTLDVPDEAGNAYRYCLSEWAQAGSTADYTFLYRV